VHSLSAAWRRLQLLSEAVVDQGAALTEEQTAKERELLVGIRDRLAKTQVGHNCANLCVCVSRCALLARACKLGCFSYEVHTRGFFCVQENSEVDS